MSLKSLARKKLEGKLVGGNFSDLANYSELFSRTHDCILLLDPAGFEVLQVNPACERTLGVAMADLVGEEFTAFFDELTRARLGAFLSQPSAKSIDLRWSSTKTAITLELSASVLELADYCSVLQLIARDVTELRERERALESLSVTDQLTALPNRRAFDRALEQAQQSGESYAVLLLDVDNFKHFNDRNGHAAGDIALKEVGRVLREHQSAQVFTARYGGEEFVAVTQDVARAAELAESIRAAVQASRAPHAEAQPLGFLSVSIGIAAWSKDKATTSAHAILETADRALYQSKQAGRNRVTVDGASPADEARVATVERRQASKRKPASSSRTKARS